MKLNREDSTMRLTGHKAIEYVEGRVYSPSLHKDVDSKEGVRYGLTLAEAREIAKEDPELIFLGAVAVGTPCPVEGCDYTLTWTGNGYLSGTRACTAPPSKHHHFRLTWCGREIVLTPDE